jgi:hypothetical protein
MKKLKEAGKHRNLRKLKLRAVRLWYDRVLLLLILKQQCRRDKTFRQELAVALFWRFIKTGRDQDELLFRYHRRRVAIQMQIIREREPSFPATDCSD